MSKGRASNTCIGRVFVANLLQIGLNAISFEALLTNSEQIKFSLCLKRNKNLTFLMNT